MSTTSAITPTRRTTVAAFPCMSEPPHHYVSVSLSNLELEPHPKLNRPRVVCDCIGGHVISQAVLHFQESCGPVRLERRHPHIMEIENIEHFGRKRNFGFLVRQREIPLEAQTQILEAFVPEAVTSQHHAIHNRPVGDVSVQVRV